MEYPHLPFLLRQYQVVGTFSTSYYEYQGSLSLAFDFVNSLNGTADAIHITNEDGEPEGGEEVLEVGEFLDC